MPQAQRRRLAEAFYRVYPDLKHSIPQPIRASCDLAVAQFPGHRNSVGFLAFFTCPGATPQCAACCYTEGGQAGMESAKDFRAKNTHALLELCRRRATRRLAEQLGRLMDEAHAQYEDRLRRACGTELRRLRRGSIFRHNWSGDLVDATHAWAVQRAVYHRPHIQSWLYTRSFHLLPDLEPVPPQLTVWVSDDGGNRQEAARALSRHPWARQASLVRRAQVQPGDLVCPKLRYRPGADRPVLSYRHACAICRICVTPSAKVSRVVFPEKTHRNQNPIPTEVSDILQIETGIERDTRYGAQVPDHGPMLVRERPEGRRTEARYFVCAFLPVDPDPDHRELVSRAQAEAEARHAALQLPDNVYRVLELLPDGQVRALPGALERAAEAALGLIVRQVAQQRPYVTQAEWLDAADRLGAALREGAG